MGILLAFTPFLCFAVVDRLIGPTQGLLAGTIISLGLVLRDALVAGRSPKILEVGTSILFCSLTACALLGRLTWSPIGVRLCVDAGLLIIVLTTIAIGRPFTLQYAREQVGAEHHASPAFRRTNYIISGVWALAFAVMVTAELALLYMPEVPHRLGLFAIAAALVGAVKFTGWYPAYARRKPVVGKFR